MSFSFATRRVRGEGKPIPHKHGQSSYGIAGRRVRRLCLYIMSPISLEKLCVACFETSSRPSTIQESYVHRE